MISVVKPLSDGLKVQSLVLQTALNGLFLLMLCNFVV